MAKSNKKQVQNQKVQKPKTSKNKSKPKVRNYSSDVYRDLDLIAQHIADPCNSDLSASGLPGQKGFVSRFSANQVFTVEAGKHFWEVIFPGALNFDNGFPALGIDTYTPDIFSIGGPGTGFFNGGPGYDYRVLGYCVEMFNITNTMSRGGSWSALHTTVDQVHKVESTVNTYRAAANERGSFGTNDSVMIKWRPGLLDDTYGLWHGAQDGKTEPAEFSDKNALAITISAPSENQSIELRHVAIVEWIPRIGVSNLGLSTPTVGASTHNIRSSQVAAMLDRQDPHWWFEVGKMARSSLVPLAKSAIRNLMGMNLM